MNVLIIYATYSGSTFSAAQHLEQVLQQKQYQVVMKNALEAHPDELHSPDLVVLTSPSWDVNGEEGMPHEDFQTFQAAVGETTYPQKPFAIMGLGDSNYKHFCGAVSHLEKWVQDKQGVLKQPSLKLDQYYFDEEARKQEIDAWAEKL